MPHQPHQVVVPAGFDAFRGRGPEMATWLDRLPALLDELLEDWQLGVDGEATYGFTAVVVPVRTTGGRPAALKVGWPHEESEHEHLALRHWRGRAAVELLRADPRRGALLLERLHHEDLSEVWDVEACEVVGGLYAGLHVPAPPPLRRLSTYAARWGEELTALPASGPLPHRMVQQAAAIARAFAADPGTDGRLVHTDLHYANVLAADREPWLAIDPKPLSGDPHAEVAPLLWNRFEELEGDVRRGVRARFHAVVDAAMLEEDRARDWVVLRMLVLATERLRDPPGTTRRTSDEDLFTMCVAVAKAVQD